jgi:hypothetical protein
MGLLVEKPASALVVVFFGESILQITAGGKHASVHSIVRGKTVYVS